MENITPAYWPTRILLAVGIVCTLVVFIMPQDLGQGSFTDDRSTILGFPTRLLIGVGVRVVALVGLAVMVRIFRGPSDETPAWRHRDR